LSSLKASQAQAKHLAYIATDISESAQYDGDKEDVFMPESEDDEDTQEMTTQTHGLLVSITIYLL
jgi:hypothetical protein